MLIGQAAQLSGASQRAIRLYEEMGLLDIKRRGAYRFYSNEDLAFIKMIKEAQSLGIKLIELKALKKETNDLDWQAVLQILMTKSQQAKAEIQRLHHYIAQLETYHQEIQQCLKNA